MEKPSLPDIVKWSETTRKWYQAWHDSPRTDSWDMVRWLYLFDTALVYQDVWSGKMQFINELRIRCVQMGVDFYDLSAFDEEVTPLDEIISARDAGVSDTDAVRVTSLRAK